MAEPDESSELQPLMQPRLVRFLKNRPKLVDRGVREEFLEEVEERMMERRKPDTVAERTVRRMFNEVADAAAPPTRRRVRERLSRANETVLENM